MKRWILLAVLLIVPGTVHAQKAKEWKLNLAPYGLVKARCAWYPGRVEFVDDNHLVISAPVNYTCNKDERDKAADTRITVVDLHGHKVASVRRRDVIEMDPGPVGYLTLCSGSQFALLSSQLEVATTIAIPPGDKFGGCYLYGGISPSRTAIAIFGPASQLRLYQATSNGPILEIPTVKGQSFRAVADDGFLVCRNDKDECQVVGSHGVLRSFPVPVLGGASGYYIVGLVAPDRLLVASFDGKHLYAETPAGQTVPMGDIARIKPPFIDSSDTQISATEPRRILYRVDGCLLGDFDDCYGVVFRRFAVFDSQTSRMVFRHSYESGAAVRISPDGRTVMEQDGPTVQLFRLP